MDFGLFHKKKEDPLDKLRPEVEENPLWKLVFAGRRLCPYCAGGYATEKDPAFVEAALRHAKDCAKWAAGKGAPLDRAAILLAALRQFIKTNLNQGGAWIVLDDDRRWICPYDGQPTEIRLPEDRKITPEILTQMTLHLRGCSFFNPLRPPRDEAYLRETVAAQGVRRQLEEKIRAQLENDPVLRFADPAGRWVCPWCRTHVSSVDVSSQFALRNSAPAAIAKHLHEGCGAWQARQPRATVAELESLFAAPRRRSNTGNSTVLHIAQMESLRKEIEGMRQHISEQQETAKNVSELQKSLDLARQRQLKMLPSIPEVAGLQFHVWYSPCASVSGDFYDFIKVSDKITGVLIGDVSGHGIEAALIMSMAKKSLQMHGRGQTDPAAALKAANADLVNELERGTFVTVFYAVIDTEKRTATCCRAGHTPLIRVRPGGAERLREFNPNGIGLGMSGSKIFDAQLKTEVVPFEPGDVCLLYTDGVPEAMNRKQEEFGLERMRATVERYAEYDPDYLVFRLRSEIEKFSGGKAADDDMTVIAIRATKEAP